MNKAIPLRKLSWVLLPLWLLMVAPSLAFAHTGVGSASGFLQGITHPLMGCDHLCAMIAVGLWAAQRGGRTIWIVPLAFVSVMAVGGALGMATGSLPVAERGIAASVLVLGVLVAAAVRLPLVASAILVGVFALFHGHSHGAETPESAAGLIYAGGFLLSTLALHAVGVATGLLVAQMPRLPVVRFAGAAMAMFGLYLCLS